MSLPKFTPHMLSYQPDQTAYLLNKLAEGHGGGGGTLYNTTGQHTDGAMTQKATTDALGTKANATDVGNALAGKVDKEVGKGLSSNDFTDADKTKLGGIESGAQVNVQSDWDQADNTKDDYIKNKPTIPPGVELYNSTGQNTDGAMTQKATTDALDLKVDAVSGKGLSSNDFTDADVSKLSGIEAGAEVNVQADWNQTDTSADDYIQNKPTIPGPYTLPPATTSTLGGIIVGNNLTVAADGTLSANAGSLPSNLVYHDTPGTVTPVTPYVSFADLIWSGIFDKIYPVGSIFMSATLSTPADVATALGGGTWVAWGSGRVPVGVDTNDASFDTVEETGGEKTHTLTVTEMPSHRHQERGWYELQNPGSSGRFARSRYELAPDPIENGASLAAGGDGAHNNLQPYITCYMYKRTA